MGYTSNIIVIDVKKLLYSNGEETSTEKVMTLYQKSVITSITRKTVPLNLLDVCLTILMQDHANMNPNAPRKCAPISMMMLINAIGDLEENFDQFSYNEYEERTSTPKKENSECEDCANESELAQCVDCIVKRVEKDMVVDPLH